MDPKLKRLILNSPIVVWFSKYGLFILTFFLSWFLGRWHFREFASAIPFQREIITPDELYWVLQSLKFRQALIDGNLQGLVQSAHPGFITMWLGSIGATIKLWLEPELQSEVSWLVNQTWVLPQTGELSHRLYPFLETSRNALRWLVTGLWLGIFQLLKERIHDKRVLFLTIFLLITDMWVLGLTNILHVDGLLALFCFISLLLVLPINDTIIKWHHPMRYTLAGVTMACAILSKVPGLVLLIIVPSIIIIQQIIIARRFDFASKTRFLKFLGFLFLGFFVTIGVFAPIVFINPQFVYDNVFTLSAIEVGFKAPTFFLGQITEDPGLLFYPLTNFFRQQIFVTIGLAIALVQLIQNRGKSNHWILAGTFIGFSTLFWLGLLVSDREFARYAIPVFLISSFIGAVAFGKFITSINQREGSHFFLRVPVIATIVVLFIFAIRTAGQLDPFVFTNQLVGGNRVGPRLMLAGWGGSHSSAAAFANEIPFDNQIIFTDNIPATAPFIGVDYRIVLLLNEQMAKLVRPNDIVILSQENRQLNPERWERQIAGEQSSGSILDQIPSSTDPTLTIDSGGLPRVYVFSDFDPTILDSGVDRFETNSFVFNNSLALSQSTIVKSDNEFNLDLLLRWRTQFPSEEIQAIEDGVIQLTITDESGKIWVRREDPLIDINSTPSSLWTAGYEHLTVHPLPLASDMPPANYSVNIRYFTVAGSLAGVNDDQNRFVGTVANLASFQVEVPSPQPPVAYSDNSVLVDQNGIRAIGQLPESIGQGEILKVDLWLQPESLDQGAFSLDLKLGDETFSYMQDTTNWKEEFVYQVSPAWRLPVDLLPDAYQLDINSVQVGEIAVELVERNFELNPNVGRRGVEVEGLGEIHAFWLTPDSTNVNLIWEVNEPSRVDYSLFIILFDENFNTLYEINREPGRPTSQTVENEILQVTESLPEDILPEAQFMVAGFVDPTTGIRLPLTRLSDGWQPPARYISNNLNQNNE